VWEVWGALANGGRLVVVPDELTRDPARFRQLLLDESVTILNQTPSSFRALLHADLEATGSRSGYQLRSVVLGGEMLEVASLAPWLERYGDQQPTLVNMYGITETTVHVTYRPIRQRDLVAGVPSPIGEPIADLAVRLVDPRGRLVPVGVPGEIYVGGAGVARGYLHRPELTSARFVDPPAGADPGSQRWYRTGDRARWLPGGGLEFLGRVDDQVKIRGYRIELGEIESVLNSHPQVSEAVVVARETGAGGHRQLIAYVVPAPPTESTDDSLALPPSQLRSWLSQRLPDYLVPAGFIDLDRLPLTPNGKVDRSALPATGPARPDEVDLVAPRTEVERVLAEVWAEVLGVERLGTADNFFALGGDSILTIQAVSRANRRGVSITPAQLFAHQTIAELARVAVIAGAAGGAEQGEVTGDVPPTPVQAWFWQLDLPHAGHWNLPVLLAARRPVRLEWLTRALAALVAHHDLLRLRVAAGGPRRGHQYIAPVAEHGPVPVREFDLSALDRHQFSARIDELARHLQSGFDLEREPLLRAAVFRAPAGELDRVLLVPHHLVADAVSLRILIEDLDTACRQLAEDRPIELPRKTTDFPQWARQLAQRAATSEVAEQASWWLANLPPQAPALPVDGDRESPNLEADLELVETTLDEAATRQLLTPAQRAYRTKPDELLLAALVQAMTRWTGVPQLMVDVEGHGRDATTGELDLSRTVGWFTTLAPAWLDCSGVDDRDPQQLIKSVKEQLRAMPGHREAYGLARWLREDDLARQLSGLPRPAVSFNYLGRLDLGGPDDGWFTLASEPLDAAHHPANPRPYLLDVVVGVQQGRLHLYLAYSSRLHERATIERLAGAYLDALRAIIDHCVSPGAGGPTPSDFPLARVEAPQLDRLAAGYGPIADLYPLSPLQQGLLFHTLANPGSGVYFEQFSMRLDGELDVDAFERAWSAVIERHPVLRAGIAWTGLAVPHLVVRERVALPLRHHHWRELAGAQPAAELERLLSDDRIRGFDLTRAPLTRLQLIRLGQHSWQLVWSHHHLLLDGWSVSLLIQEIFDNYEALRTGRYLPSPPPPSYRDYLDHLAGLDFSEAWPYWRRVLSGVTGPTPLGADRPAVTTGRRDTDYARVQRRLAAAESAAVREFARAHRLTLDTVLHGAWALLLAHRSGQDDVVFGVTSSGRPPALAGVEQMVGLFVNTLPARVWVSRDQPVVSWLSGLLREQVQAREFEHTPLDQVRSWSSVPAGRPLFDSIRGLENYPVDGSRFRTGSITVSDIRTFEQTNYALSFVVIPDDALITQVWYDALRFAPETADRVLATVQALILALVADPDRSVGEVLEAAAARYGQPGPPQVGQAPLPQLVEAWAAHEPQRTAVTGDGIRLTYRELDERANQLADRLRELGAGPGTPVGTALSGVDRVVAMLAILKAGAVCVPLPAGEPAAWQRHPLSLCLVAPGQHRDGVPEAVPVEVLDSGSLDGRPTVPPGIPIGLTDPAILVRWEAPDGTVAATALTHGELARRVHARRDDITGIDVVGQLADPASEPAAWETWVALGNGAGLALPPADCPPGAPARWRRLRGEQPVTVVTMAAGDLPELLDQDPRALAGVRRLLLRGELPTAYARRLRTTHRSVAVLPAVDLEAGRIAHQLRELPMVREAVLLPTSDGRRLTAYLLPDTGAAERGGGRDSGSGDGPDSGSDDGSDSGSVDPLAARHVELWRTLYDRTYADSDPTDPTFNIVGWNSSYTGRAIAEEAMAEWRAGTMARIRDLRPARVLEIGCGTGLLLFGLLADCDHYVGADFSAVCLAQLRQHLGTRDTATQAKVTLLECHADDLHGLEPGSFDVVILNSVVQYFPGSSYLDRVLAEAIRFAAPTGAIFVGDLRHHGLREAFHTSVELHRAVDMLPTAQLYDRVTRALEQERELLVDPGYFAALAGRRPEIAAVEVMPRRGKHDTELTRYRYDAILRLGTPPPEPADVQWYDWRRDVLSRSEIGWLLENADGDAVGITGVPNARVAADVEAARLLTDLDGPGTAGELRLAAGKAPAGVDPEELYELAERLGWTVAVSWATHRADGGLNALFRRGPDRMAGIGALHTAGSGPGRERVRDADDPLTNTPLRSSLVGELEEQAWRALRETLPDYAGVSRVLVMDEFPRTADGRVDEAALPALADDEDPEPLAAGAIPPRTADELRLARIWERALGLRSVDVRASFFELGGDSLLAIRVIDEATRALGREVPMAVLLQEPTIEAMAAALRAEPADWTPLVEVTPGDGTPFFCVHPAGGGVLCYAELARLLAPQPFCALQARGFDRDDPPYDDLAAMAERYLVDVRARQARGPYLLGGWSMGGLVAYEMAQQLLAAGEQVELLVLIDTPTPDHLEDLPDEAAVLVRLLESVVPLDPAQLRSLPAAERLRHVLAEAERLQAVPPGLEVERAAHLFQVYATHLDAIRRYRLRPYGGRVCQLRATQTDPASAEFGWREFLTGQFDVVEVPGTHETVLWPPNVQQLAERLRAQLAAARPPQRRA
jgi:non-ribosomal peptide synthase protein (TIGR01720 family)